jgi:hypothetical protein
VSARPPANPLRGEVALRLGDEVLRLRPSFERLVAAEGETGSLVALLERAADGDARLEAIEALFWHCQEGVADRARFRALLPEAGLERLLPAYRSLLSAVFRGADDR